MAEADNEPPRFLHAIVIACLVVLGIVVRWVGLSDFHWSPDDVLILGIAQSPSLGAMFDNALREVHPPFFYFVLRCVAAISDADVFLRAAMIAIGLGCVPILYLTGLRFLGPVAAVVMGLLPALSVGAVIETAALRHYSVVMLLSSIGFYLFLRQREAREPRVLYAYGVVVLLGALTHYSQLLLFAGLGVVRLVELLRVPETRKDAGRFVAVQVPAALVALYFVWSHISKQWAEGVGHYDYIVNTAYKGFFPTSAAMWGKNLVELGTFLSFANVGGFVAIALALCGLVALALRQRVVCIAIAAVFALQVLAAVVRFYPLGPTRHALYLLPLFAFVVGMGVQTLAGLCRGKQVIVGLTLVSLAAAWGTYDLLANRSYRGELKYAARIVSGDPSRYWGHSSFPVERAEFDHLMQALDRNVRAGEYVVTNRQSSMYLRHKAGLISGRKINDLVYSVPYRGATFFYLDDRSAVHDVRFLRSFVETMAKNVKWKPDDSVLLFTVGWHGSVMENVARMPSVKATGLLAQNRAGALMRVKLDLLLRLLKR